MALFFGCFTEAGNAEDEQVVKAEFEVNYTLQAAGLGKAASRTASTFDTGFDTSTVRIENFYLLVREAEIHNTDGTEQHLWRENSAGLPVDITGRDTLARLPFRIIPRRTFANFKLEFQLPARRVLRADTVDIASFTDRGYVVGHWQTSTGPLPFVFALPTGTLSLFYEMATLDAWLMGKTYDCRFVFYGSRWLDSAGLESASRVFDRNSKPFVLLDSTSNGALYQKLAKKFYRSFNTSQVVTTPRSGVYGR